jgi:hypothetical protein
VDINEELNGQFLSTDEVFGQFHQRVFCQQMQLMPWIKTQTSKPEVVTSFSISTSELLTVTEIIFQNLGICKNLNTTL